MDERIKRALERFVRNEIGAFRRPVESGLVSDPLDPVTFARLCVYLAVHRFDVPLYRYEDAVTEGAGDCGLDGVAVAVGSEPLESVESARWAAEEAIAVAVARSPDEAPGGPRPRVLLVQSKRNPKCSNNEVKLFGVDALDFLTASRGQLRAQRPNDAVRRWWEIYNAIRQVYRKRKVPFEVETELVFAYSGIWSEDRERPEGSRQVAERRIRESLGHDRARFSMWGADELANALPLAPAPPPCALPGVTVVPLPPNAPARGYIGYAPATSIVGLLPRVAGELDDRVFVDNVRSFLGTGKESNPGAVGLAHTLECGRGEEVLLKHNGITIVADEADLRDGTIQLEGYQIVNGAQTSHVLHRKRHLLHGVSLPVKVVVTRDEALKDEIIRGANTQSPVDDFDFLSRVAGVRVLETAFLALAPDDPAKLWLQRRRGERFYDPGCDPARVVTPRQLMEGFAAAVLGKPHAVHSNPADFLELVKREEIFHPGHEPWVYLAMGWLVVAGRRWASRNNQRWEARFEVSRDGQAYPARFQFLHALWNQVDPGSPQSGLEAGSAAAESRFRGACEVLRDAGRCKRHENAVGQAIHKALTSGKAKSAQVRAQGFAERVQKGVRGPAARDSAVPGRPPRRKKRSGAIDGNGEGGVPPVS